MSKSSKGFYNAVVRSNLEINPTLRVLKIKPDFKYQFKPGQFYQLGLTYDELGIRNYNPKRPILKRAYSISSAPSNDQYVEFYIVEVEGGALSPSLCQLKEGERVWISPSAKGKMVLEKDQHPGKTLLMMATGTGIAPFVSMVREYVGSDHPWKKIIMLRGVRYKQDLGYYEELKKLSDNPSNKFTIIDTVSRDDNWDGYRGRITQYVMSGGLERDLNFNITPADCHVFLCGNPAMIEQMQELFENKGFILEKGKIQGNLHVEKYW